MISGKLIAVALAAAVALSAFTGWRGYVAGYAAAEADQRAALLSQIEAGQKLEAARRALALERDDLARQLEEESHATPVYVDRCLAPDRVRRLNTIR